MTQPRFRLIKVSDVSDVSDDAAQLVERWDDGLGIAGSSLLYAIIFLQQSSLVGIRLYNIIKHSFCKFQKQFKGQHGFYIGCHWCRFLLHDNGHETENFQIILFVFIVLPLPYGELKWIIRLYSWIPTVWMTETWRRK